MSTRGKLTLVENTDMRLSFFPSLCSLFMLSFKVFISPTVGPLQLLILHSHLQPLKFEKRLFFKKNQKNFDCFFHVVNILRSFTVLSVFLVACQQLIL